MKLVDAIFGDLVVIFLRFFKKKVCYKVDSPKKVLFINLVAMGDLIMMAPLASSTKKSYGCRVDLLTNRRTAPLVEAQGLYDKIYYLDFDFLFLFRVIKLIHDLRKEKYDVIFETEFYYRITAIIGFLAKPLSLIGFNLGMRSILFDERVIYDANINVSKAYMNLAISQKKFQADYSPLPLRYSEQDKCFVDNLVFHQKNLFIIHFGTSKRAVSRRWEDGKWCELFNKLDEKYTIVLVGGEEEKIILDRLLVQRTDVINLIGKLNLRQLFYLCTKSVAYIGLDTGPTHLAASAGVPLVALYGPNTPVTWGPNSNSKYKVIYKPVACSPCTRQYQGIVSNCKDNKCMRNITVKEVLDAINQIT